MKKTFAVAAIAAVGVIAHADTISYTNSFPSTLTEWSTTLNLPQFNSTLGTLDSIDISLYSSMSSLIHITNSSAGGASGNFASELQIFATDPGTYDLFGVGSNPVIDNTSPAKFKYTLASFVGSGTNSPTLYASGGADSGAIVDSSTLTLFTGTGTVGLPVSTLTLEFGTINGNQAINNVTSADLQSIVTYDYTAPVPEPSTFAMIGTGLAGLGMVFRRRSVK